MSGEVKLPAVGETASLNIDITPALIDRFAELTGDCNPIHMDADAARALGFRDRVAHGMSYSCFLSTLIGTRLPGPGSLWASQTYRFLSSVYVGDSIALHADVVEVSETRRNIKLRVSATNGAGEPVMEGESQVFLPRGRSSVPISVVSSSPGRPVALIAGASGMLGEAVSRRLGQDGYAVALCARNLDRLGSLAAELQADGVAASAVKMDLASEESVIASVAEATRSFGGASLVVHCASAPLGNQAPQEVEWAVFQKHLAVQLGGLRHLARATVPEMLAKGGGQFIYIGSSATHGAPPQGLAAYSSAKSAAATFARSVANELGPRGIRANVISPHFLATDLTAAVSEKQRKLVAARTPIRRLIDIEEVAATVGFLADVKNTFMNGHDLLLDGGAIMA